MKKKKHEIKHLQEDNDVDLCDIDSLKEEINELENSLDQKHELLERYKELSEVYCSRNVEFEEQ